MAAASQWQNLLGEYATVQALQQQIIQLCNSALSAGTTFKNDSFLNTAFPNDGPIMKTWLTSTGAAMNTFLAALTAMPQLNS